jgi:hypothetical protein
LKKIKQGKRHAFQKNSMNIYSGQKEQKCDRQSHFTHAHHDKRKQKKKRNNVITNHIVSTCISWHLKKRKKRKESNMTQ